MTTHHASVALARSSPEAQGIASAALLAFLEEAVETIEELHSFMLLRHGQVVAEGWWSPYGAALPHVLFSLSKSFTSTAAGMAIAEGRFSLDSPVVSFFPDDLPAEISDNLATMRVRHLLSMSTGHAQDTTSPVVRTQNDNWVQAFLAQPVDYPPGTHFVYNSGATYMVSAILQKVTGMTLLEYLTPRLFAPLGITGATWETCPRGINVGGWGLSVKTEDIARFGQLYLQKGVWNGERLLSEAWVAEATSSQVSNGDDANSDWAQGYGYQFWRCRHGAYRGDGAFGQYCVVLPEQEAVIAITAGVSNMQAVLNLVWKHLLPAMAPKALPEDGALQAALQSRLASLALRTPDGHSSSPLADMVSGNIYLLEPNPQNIASAAFEFSPGKTIIRLQSEHREYVFVCGLDGEWLRGTTTFHAPAERPVAVTGAWKSDTTFVAKLCFYETPFCPTLTCHFMGDQVRLNYQENVSFGPTEHPPLIGKKDA